MKKTTGLIAGLILLGACGKGDSRPPVDDFTADLIVTQFDPVIAQVQGKQIRQQDMIALVMNAVIDSKLKVGEVKVLARALDDRFQLRCKDELCSLSREGQ